jgi:protein TonB
MPLLHPRTLLTLACVAATLWLASCSSRRPPPPAPLPVPAPAPPTSTATAPAPARGPATTIPAPVTPPPAAVRPPEAVTPPFPSSHVSHALTAKAYRRDAASHLYAANAGRIHKGMMQPNLYAIGVLDVDIDRQGQVTGIQWRRAPSHAPEVMAEIVRTVRAAAPFPAPTRMGRVTYTDTWLWDKSGKFQLDTLTEGQL